MLMKAHAAIDNKNKLVANMRVEVRCGDGVVFLLFLTQPQPVRVFLVLRVSLWVPGSAV